MTVREEAFDVVILGAGAAGLMCALTAGQRGRKVLLIEQADKVGSKILISGGGRCNFTNTDCVPSRFISDNPHFCKSALGRYRAADFIALIERHNIAYHEKTLGQLFCDGSARAVVAMLLDECGRGNVDVRLNETVTSVTGGDGFRVETSRGSFTAPSLVLATGGLSIPKMGATGFSYGLARQFGLRVTPTRPGLVPFTASTSSEFDVSLAGVAVEAIATFEKQRFRENILFTHRGLSGPAILQVSSYWQPGREIALDFTAGRDVLEFLIERKRSRAKSMPQTVLAEIMPARLAQVLAGYLPVSEMANISDKTMAAFVARLRAWPYQPVGTEGYAKAEVTCGGIDTRDLSSKTMAATNGCGLYAIGEAVDVTGWLGGYNFQWAWSSGWSAGQAV